MRKTTRDRIAQACLPRIMSTYLRFTALTSKIRIYGSEYPDQLIQYGSGFTYAFWHNRQIVLPMIRKDEHIHCLISSSRDGEYIARVAALFGKTAIRGSSTRGGFEAMKQIMRTLQAGQIVAMTPDGPLGPPGEVKPGIIQVSRALGTPIVPLAFDASRKKVFASWDRFILPYPFGRISIVFGQPVVISETESDQAGCARLKRALDDVTTETNENLKS